MSLPRIGDEVRKPLKARPFNEGLQGVVALFPDGGVKSAVIL